MATLSHGPQATLSLRRPFHPLDSQPISLTALHLLASHSAHPNSYTATLSHGQPPKAIPSFKWPPHSFDSHHRLPNLLATQNHTISHKATPSLGQRSWAISSLKQPPYSLDSRLKLPILLVSYPKSHHLSESHPISWTANPSHPISLAATPFLDSNPKLAPTLGQPFHPLDRHAISWTATLPTPALRCPPYPLGSHPKLPHVFDTQLEWYNSYMKTVWQLKYKSTFKLATIIYPERKFVPLNTTQRQIGLFKNHYGM